MYLGRERLGTRKNPQPAIREMQYTEEDLSSIEETVESIKRDYPEFTDREARVWEVISRFRGDNGLSAASVSYIVSALMEIIT